MADKSTLNKLYFEILLSKNKLPLLQTYYSNIKNEILTDLTNLHNLVTSAQSWVNAQINYLNTTRTAQATKVNNFVASSSDNLIVSHEKYLEMMERYKEYVSSFYTRIHSLENISVSNSYTVSNFTINEIGQLSSFWKFHYTDNYGNALPIEHKFCALNITSESVILEVSNSRYLYFTNENVVYDVDYVTKDVYICYLDHKVMDSVSEDAAFHTLVSLPDKSKIFAYVIDHKLSDTDVESLDSVSVFGNKASSSGVYAVICLEYDIVNHKFKVPEGNTTTLYITGELLRDYRLRLVDSAAVNDYYYVYIADYISRVKIDGTSEGYTSALPQKTANVLCDVVKFGNYFVMPQVNDSHNNTRLVACKLSSNGSIDVFNSSAYVVLNAFAENDERFNTDNQIVKIFKADNIGGYGIEGLYVVTNTNIWYIGEIVDNEVIDVKIDLRKRSIGIVDYSFVDNDGLYTIDEFGYLYILKDNTYLYCAKTDNSATELFGNVVQAPTRYADKLINLQNVVSANRAGYAFNKSDNITMAQLGDTGDEEFIYSFIQKANEFDTGVLYGITKTGKIAYCDIATGEWNSNSPNQYCYSSFTGDREITAICSGENDNVLYVALQNYAILKVTKTELIAGSGINLAVTNLVYNTLVGSRIKAMVYIDAFKTLYIATASGSVSAYDFNNDTYHTADVTSSDYSETDKSRYAITRGDDAIGNVSINCITTDGNNLIVMGAHGRVASCSLSDFMWTSYRTSEADVGNYSSNIFYDGIYEKENGTSATCRDIISFINYNNIKLIVFTTVGEIFSCNLSTGVWTDITGKIVLHGGSGFGPGIFDSGDILGGKSPFAVIRVGTTVFVSGEAARLGSISITDGGITEYRGTSENAIIGPGYAYTGEDVAETISINSMTTDNRGKIFLLGTTNCVLTYSIESNEVIVPSNSKLYYIARRQSRYDFMSSLLVRVSKGELNEKAPLYPPSEDDDSFASYIESANYVFKNGRYVWKINTALDVVYFSDDSGVSYTTVDDIQGYDTLPKSEGAVDYVSCIPNGFVTDDGKLIAVVNIGTAPNTYVLKGTSERVAWVKLNNRLSQKIIDSLVPVRDIDYLYVKSMTYANSYDKYDLTANDAIKTQLTEVTDFSDKAKIENNNLYFDNKLLVSDIYSKLSTYTQNVICDKFENFEVNQMYVTNDSDINFILVCDGVRIYVVTLHFIDLLLGDAENNWIVNFKKLDFDILGNLSIVSIDVRVNPNKTNAVALVNYEVNNNAYLKTKGRAVIVSLLSDVYGEYNVPNYKILNRFDSFAKIVSYDSSEGKIFVALYNTADTSGMITHTNSVHSYTVVDSVINTPIRALTNAWKTCQVELGNGSDNSVPNAIALRLKFNCNNDQEQDIVSVQFTLRYRVLISDITNGKFILFETEKSVGMSKTDDDTRTIEPLFRVLAIDGFEDEIFDLFTSKFDRYHKVTSTMDLSEATNYSYDFMTFIQRFTGDSNAVYQIKICCENTLPSNIDATFYVEPYYQDTTAKATYVNKIATSEYNVGLSEAEANGIFGKNVTGFIESTLSDRFNLIKTPVSVNTDYEPQKETTEKIGISADTYMCIVRGDGNSLFDKTSCVIMAKDNEYVIVPLSKNKKELKYVFDESGSAAINSRSAGKIDTLRNGRSVHKMRNRSVFSKGVINNPDYYTDYKGKGRIVSVEGTLTNRFGLFEAISTIDGNQKRIKQISEIRDGTKWNNNSSAYDVIKKRDFGYGYDYVDRYSVFEAPYNMIKAWWIPAKSLIAKGNERLHNFTFNEGKRSDVGLKYSPFDTIDNPASINTKIYAGGNNPVNHGINATMNGQTVASPDTVEAYTELIDEKFPLENWKGWEWAKMCFIRKWRRVFTDKHIEYKYEVEAPSRVTVSANGTVTLTGSPIHIFDTTPYTDADFQETGVPEFISAITPSIDRQLYWYSDSLEGDLSAAERARNEFEGIGVETWRRATAYYYTSHNWTCVLDEILTLDHENFFDDNDETLNDLRELNNIAQISDADFDTLMANATNVSKTWYVTSSTDSVNTDNLELRHYDSKYDLDTQQSAPHKLDDTNDESSVDFKRYPFPIATLDDGNVVGERVVNVTFNAPEEVVRADVSSESLNWSTGAVMPKSHYIKKWIRGIGTPITKTSDNELVAYVPVNGYLDENNDAIDVEDMYKYAASVAAIDPVEDQTAINRKLIEEYVGNTVAKLTVTIYSALESNHTDFEVYTSVESGVKTDSLDNTCGFNYGLGKVMYATNEVYDSPSNTISVKVRSYYSISKADLVAHPELEGKFVGYYDTIYTATLTSDPITRTVSVAYSPVGETKFTISAGVLPTIDSYCGKSSFRYLFKNIHTLNINNLIKNTGYTSVSKEIIAWNIKDAVLTEAVEDQVYSHLEDSDFSGETEAKSIVLTNDSEDVALIVDLLSAWSDEHDDFKNSRFVGFSTNSDSLSGGEIEPTDTLAAGDSITVYGLFKVGDFDFTSHGAVAYPENYIFLTQSKGQTYSNGEQTAVDRVFVKQYFPKEKTANDNISWASYASLYSKSISTYPTRANNTYPQTYVWLDLFDKNLNLSLSSETINSVHCWVHLESGSVSNKNLKIVSDSADGLDSYVAGEFCYVWYDGTIKKITFTIDDHITLQNLVDKGFISSYGTKTEVTQRRENSDLFDKITTIVVAGYSIKHDDEYIDVVESNVTLYASEIVEYAENVNTVGDNTTVANVVNWDAGSTGTGDPAGTGFEESYDGTGVENNETFNVNYNLTDMKVQLNTTEQYVSIGTDTAHKYTTYSAKIKANDGYKLPASISVRIGDTTGTVGAESYSYDRSYVTVDSYAVGSAATIGDIVDGLAIPADDATYEFVAFSLDGVNPITAAERATSVTANTTVNIYSIFNNKKEARFTVFGEKITGTIEVTGNAEYVVSE